ncbi:MAG: 3-phytase [Robiginitomaculum sp.]|nr:MAG: 3-phytase [Robiginitomaculum sp.]
MKKTFITLSLCLTGCASASGGDVASLAGKDVFSVQASFEAPIVSSRGDSADDPAIYIGKDGQGFVAGTDKQAGLYIYNLDGSIRKFHPLGTLNNVDLRDGFRMGGRDYVLLVASNDELNNITVLLYDIERDVFVIPSDNTIDIPISPYGICLGRTVNGTFHAGITTKKGVYQQYRISEQGGQFSATKVREFSTGTKTEGCVFDDRTGSLYIAEEEGGLYRYASAPSGKDEQLVIARPGQYGLEADFEGVSIYEQGRDGGYLLVSSQGNSSYGVFHLPDYKFSGRFEVVDGVVDGTSITDGIAVSSVSSAKFPEGFLVVQDDQDDQTKDINAKRQNFKFIDWRVISAHLED